MNYDLRQINGISVIDLQDDIDSNSTPYIWKFTIALLKESKIKKVIITMETVKFIELSSGLSMILNLIYFCKHHDIDLKFANLSVEAERVFDFTRLNDICEIHDSVEKAIQSFDPITPYEENHLCLPSDSHRHSA